MLRLRLEDTKSDSCCWNNRGRPLASTSSDKGIVKKRQHVAQSLRPRPGARPLQVRSADFWTHRRSPAYSGSPACIPTLSQQSSAMTCVILLMLRDSVLVISRQLSITWSRLVIAGDFPPAWCEQCHSSRRNPAAPVISPEMRLHWTHLPPVSFPPATEVARIQMRPRKSSRCGMLII